MDPSPLAGVMLFAAFLPGPSDVGRFPGPWVAVACRSEFALAAHDVTSARLLWQAARCDDAYKPLSDLRAKIAWCVHGEACWDAVVGAGNLRYGFGDHRDEQVVRIRLLRLAELWNLLGPLDYAAGRMPEPPRRSQLGHWLFD